MFDKRIVLKTLTGKNAGHRAIQGTCSQMFGETGLTAMPQHIDDVDFGDHSGSCRLMYEKNSYVLYVECEAVAPAEDDGA